MHKMVESLHPMNKKFAYMYLDGFVVNRIEAIIRPIHPIPSDTPRDPKLVEIALAALPTATTSLRPTESRPQSWACGRLATGAF